jgi:hypothetical protein
LCGQSARRIQIERRASGEFVHVEVTPDVVTILPSWKLDAVYCPGVKVGAPQVSLAALYALHELLIACESRLVSADGNIVTQEAQDGRAMSRACNRDQSSPSIKAANCDALSRITPSLIGGHRNPPCSSRLYLN